MDIADEALLKRVRETTVLGALDVDIEEATGERVVLALNVGPKVHQPYGYLHGGVSVLLAETGASFGTWLAAGLDKNVFGVEINANHLRPVRDGRIRSISVPIQQGKTIAVWETRVVDEQDRLVCISRCTVAIRELNET